MAFVESDIKWKYSVPSGASVGNVVIQTTPAQSLGGFLAANVISDGSLHALFAKVSAKDNEDLVTEYRCIFICNDSVSDSALAVKVWLDYEQPGGTEVSIGIDPTGASATGSAIQQAVVAASPTTAPSGVTFSAPTSYASGIALGTLAASHCFAVWVKRKATESLGLAPERVVLAVGGNNGL